MPKLTLSAEAEVIAKAKQLADEQGTSVSAMFSQFVMSHETTRSRQTAAPITRRSRGLAQVDPQLTDRQLFEQAIAARDKA
ncbi:MAG: DUF6364 family protein [Phycisphaeraceae bacterium JB051]